MAASTSSSDFRRTGDYATGVALNRNYSTTGDQGGNRHAQPVPRMFAGNTRRSQKPCKVQHSPKSALMRPILRASGRLLEASTGTSCYCFADTWTRPQARAVLSHPGSDVAAAPSVALRGAGSGTGRSKAVLANRRDIGMSLESNRGCPLSSPRSPGSRCTKLREC